MAPGTSRIAHWLALCVGVLTLLGASVAEAAVRGKKARPDIRTPRTTTLERTRVRRVRLPITLHFATESGRSIASRHTVDRWVRRANRALASAGIEVEVVAVRRLPAGYTSITRRAERRDLAHYAPHDGTIHVFVADSLDLRYRWRARRRVRGLHWRYFGLRRNLKNREYLVVTSDAPETTLAHEIGHLLGLRHSLATDNIMCSCREAPARFTSVQSQNMWQGARDLLSRHRTARLRADRRR